MDTRIITPGVVEISATEAELQAMRDNGMALYWTPGAAEPYWASQPQFALDTPVATPEDFLRAAGYETWSELAEGEEGEMLTLTVSRPNVGLLTTKQAAEALGVAACTIRKWAPRWPGAQKLGRDWLIPASRLDWWHEQDHEPGRK